MKDIKSILIGVFATTCLFLFIGQTSHTYYNSDDIMRKLKDIDGNLIYGMYYKIDCDNLDDVDCDCN